MNPKVLRGTRTIRAIGEAVRRPPYVRPGHFYSPSTSADDVSRAIQNRTPPVGVDLREAEQLALASELGLKTPAVNRWRPQNRMFGAADAAILQGMLRHFKPSRMVEVGSGFSTAAALDVSPGLPITCVEPYPERLKSVLRAEDDVTLLEKPVQEIPAAELAALVGPGDVFFIDSTHVAKAGSDVCWLLLQVLPRLAVGTLVHVHDVQWPFEYPDHWLREGRDWNEAYMLHAFLAHNSAWQIRLFGSWLWETHPELVPEDLRSSSSGSIWLERVT